MQWIDNRRFGSRFLRKGSNHRSLAAKTDRAGSAKGELTKALSMMVGVRPGVPARSRAHIRDRE
jgi:hypothetical protein